uniref:Hflx-type G domain-containing protein n=1 Tax=Capra hircus TaxID=9925 RepID=A0A8C2XXR9_CAPHI
MSPREGPSVLACDGPCGRGPPAIPPPGTPPRPPALSSPHVLWWTHLSAHLLSQPFPARSHVKSNVAHLGGRGRSSRYTMGSGESFLQVQQRLLRDREAKIQKALERLRRKRRLLGQQRRRREFPVVSVVGYTNCGKTTLIKALTGDAAIQPRDQLFATLDVTAHAGRLPSALMVLYMDTIGFLSQLPHSLVESFSATLQDVAHSDLIVHVRDVSHPETELQKASVLSALRGLGLPDALLETPIPGVYGTSPQQSGPVACPAHQSRVPPTNPVTPPPRQWRLPRSWLHQEATVQAVDVIPEAGAADVKVIISDSDSPLPKDEGAAHFSPRDKHVCWAFAPNPTVPTPASLVGTGPRGTLEWFWPTVGASGEQISVQDG